MLNVKTLTDTMSRMELPQLQQYAALHKNDPYIVTLALSIANQKKQMQAGQAGQAGMMPQPKVVDQDIAQMSPPPARPMGGMPQGLPEDSGIGQLPAQNMQGMAAGGIVAFDDGGSVPGFAGPTGSFIGTSNVAPVPGAVVIGNMYIDPETGERKYLPGAEPAPASQRPFNGMKFPSLSDVADVFRTPYGQKQAAIARQNQAATEQNKLTTQNYVPRRSDEQQFESEVAKRNNLPDPSATVGNTPAFTLPPAPKTGTPSDTVDKLVNPVALKNTGLAALNTKPMTAAEAMSASSQFGSGSELIAGVNQLRADALKTNKDVGTAYKEGLAALPKPGEEAETRLKKREAEDVVSQADAKGMAIFKAGLGMLAGTSPNAFENIGKGAMAGLEDYSTSIKEFRKLGMERDKAYADIEASRNAAARDDFKTSVALQERAADRLAKVDEKGIDVTATLFKTNKETASTIYRDSFDQAQQNLRTQATEAGATGRTLIQERGANTRAQMGSPLNLYSKLGGAAEGSPLLKGYNIAKNEGSMERLFESYNKLANDPLNGTYFKAQHPTFESYVRNYQSGIGTGGGSGFVPLPANATVLPPK
jgi:hypothetical protein